MSSNGIGIRQHEQINGLSMSWLSWPDPGTSGKCTVVLLHGLLQRADERSVIGRHLSRLHHVVMPDLRGRGDTELPEGPCDLPALAGDVSALIEHLGLERVVVIGRNHGGAVGYTLAAERPGLVRGLVIGDTSPFISPERAAQRMEDLENTPQSFGSLNEAKTFYRDKLGLSEARADHDIPNDLEIVDGRYSWIHDLQAIRRIEMASAPRCDWEMLASIQSPALALVGQRSAIRPRTVTQLGTINPRLRVQTIAGSGPDVFLGPGAEQTRGAIGLFLMQLNLG